MNALEIECCTYTSHSHRLVGDRARIVWLPGRPVTVEEYPKVSAYLHHLISSQVEEYIPAAESSRPSQLWFYGSVAEERRDTFDFDEVEGAPLDVDAALQWFAEQPVEEQVATAPVMEPINCDPSTPIGCFNSTHSLLDILTEHGYTYARQSFDKQGHAVYRLLHPDSVSGAAGTLVFAQTGRVFAHSPGDKLFREPGTGCAHDAFSAWTVLKHGGDERAALSAALSMKAAKKLQTLYADIDTGAMSGRAAADAAILVASELSQTDYELERKSLARAAGIDRTAAFDDLVANARKEAMLARSGSVSADNAEPENIWPDPVDGDSLADAIKAELLKHIYIEEHEADIITVWIIGTYTIQIFSMFPRLHIHSPIKGCGKSTLMDVIAGLVRNALKCDNASASVLFRIVDVAQPTLLLDEADTFIRNSEDIRGIINSGFAKNGKVLRSVGEDFEPTGFPTYAAMALAGIGKLPATIMDRSIIIPLQKSPRNIARRLADVTTDYPESVVDMRLQGERWATDNKDAMTGIYEAGKVEGLSNRQRDLWRPLYAIAGGLAPDWLVRIQSAKDKYYSGTAAESEDIKYLLLENIRTVFREEYADRMECTMLARALNENPGWVWGEYRKGQPISTHSLARLLVAFKIKARATSMPVQGGGQTTVRKYHLEDFSEVFERYLE